MYKKINGTAPFPPTIFSGKSRKRKFIAVNRANVFKKSVRDSRRFEARTIRISEAKGSADSPQRRKKNTFVAGSGK